MAILATRFIVKTLPVLKSKVVVEAAVVARGIVNLNRIADISLLDTIELVAVIVPVLILVADAFPKIGVISVGVFCLTTRPDPVTPIVLKIPAAEFATNPLTFKPEIVNPVKLGELAVLTA